MDAAGSGDTFRRPWRERGCTCTCESGSDEGEEEDDRCVGISALYEEDYNHEGGTDNGDSGFEPIITGCHVDAEDLSSRGKSSAPKQSAPADCCRH